ncbi:gamma-glutamylcyclotransferase family protein [Salinirubellus sp. GCM10025818]|uniref:gamma-glutamylcyclotransferase family protein n=1 Tax=Salinirubellus TaxID=2162630 RepID=UPI0030D065E2
MDVFVYGTLTDLDRAAAVLGADRFRDRGSTRLYGLRRVDGRYPTLAPGGHVDGRLLRTERIEALDRYERVATGLYVRVSVPVNGDGEGCAAVYVGDPKRLDTAEPVEWSGEGSFVKRVEHYVRENRVAIERHD